MKTYRPAVGAMYQSPLAGCFVAAALVLATAGRGSGADLTIPIDLDGTLSHTFVSNFIRDTLGMTADPFDVDLGTLNGFTMTADLSLPGGETIVVDLPAGKTGFVEFQINYIGSGGVGTTENWAHTRQFIGLEGTPNLTDSFVEVYGRVQGNQVLIRTVYQFDAPFSFTGWRADMVRSGENQFPFPLLDQFLQREQRAHPRGVEEVDS